MKPNICFYEDHTTDNFGPLLLTRPIWELRCGPLTLAEKILKQIASDNVTFRCRHFIRKYYEQKSAWNWLEASATGDVTLFINGRVIFSSAAIAEMSNGNDEVIFTTDGEVVAFRLQGADVLNLYWDSNGILDPKSISVNNNCALDSKVINYPWQLLQSTSNEIDSDLKLSSISEQTDKFDTFPIDVITRHAHNIDVHTDCKLGAGVILSAKHYSIRLEKNVKIGVGVILDSAEGPVWIADNAEIQAGAIILGPTYIGPHSIVRPGAKLSDSVCLGPHCRVGGEVSSSTMIGYSNKQHSGYLGNAYLAEWINLGAATDNSDLKNNYKPVDVTINGIKIDSKSLHVGVFLADFTRTAIHTRLNSGTMIGVGCNIFGNDFPDKSIPSFIWYGDTGYQDYLIDKAIETISVVMSRRNEKLTSEHELLLREIYTQSQEDRNMLSGN